MKRSKSDGHLLGFVHNSRLLIRNRSNRMLLSLVLLIVCLIVTLIWVLVYLCSAKSIAVCGMQHSHLIPPSDERLHCLIPPPVGYKVPIKWPESRDEVWMANMPHISEEKSDHDWMVNGDKINFPGTKKSITLLGRMLNLPYGKLNDGGNIRTFLDLDSRVASFGAYLLSEKIIAMSLGPNDLHIQIALERGIPSTIGVMGTNRTNRFPYPSRSFEVVHCSQCRIDWIQRDGILLLEVDRLLRPGGYFVYSSSEDYAPNEAHKRLVSMTVMLRRICFRIITRRNQTVVWYKSLSNNCYLKRGQRAQPPLCNSEDDPDASWDVPMKACITPYSSKMHKERNSGLVPWPQRLTAAPPRLEELSISSEEFPEDTEIWHLRVNEYWNKMKSSTQRNPFRNIIDLKSNLGGFAAALEDKDVWVMNVAPFNSSSKLKIIYDRGLIGTVHDWCESFSTYPRTYDLIHAWTSRSLDVLHKKIYSSRWTGC